MLADTDPVWLTADEVEEVARAVVAATGEPFCVLSRSGLEGAVARPLNAWAYEQEVDIVVLAVRLLEGIGQSHCFQQGNKRAAFFAALEFIERNGGTYEARDGEHLGSLCEAVILRRADPQLLVAALRPALKF